MLSLALVGFGLKAGLVPLHFWLPGAHASAPSHVSGLMSGVMIKTGIYGLLRVISLVGAVPAWWGWTVLTLGILSGVLGVLWALAQHDLKRLLAYHSIENIGIILLGMGAGALGVAYQAPAVAVLGFAGAVLHTVNHALFKSLLFLGAGAVFRATGTRAIDQLGGLARRMPWTWVAFLVGSVAIIGLPPLNGFVSEWLVYQGLLRGGLAVGPVRVAVLGVAALALIGGLALACFAKVGGVVFLGEPRSAAAEQGRERTAGYLLPMAALALACAVIGFLPSVAVQPVLAVAGSIAGASLETVQTTLGTVVRAAWGISLVSGGVVLLLIVGWAWRRALERRRPPARSETWACGYVGSTPRMQYTAASFAAPLLQAFGRAAGVRTERTPAAFHTHPVDLVLEGVVLPRGARCGGSPRPFDRFSRAACTPISSTSSACSWRCSSTCGSVRGRDFLDRDVDIGARAGHRPAAPGTRHQDEVLADRSPRRPGAATLLRPRQTVAQAVHLQPHDDVDVPAGASHGRRDCAGRGLPAAARWAPSAAALHGRSCRVRVPARTGPLRSGVGGPRHGVELREHGSEPRGDVLDVCGTGPVPGLRHARSPHGQPLAERHVRRGPVLGVGARRRRAGAHRHQLVPRSPGGERAGAGGRSRHTPRAHDDPRSHRARP